MLVEIIGKHKGLFGKKESYYLTDPSDAELNGIINTLKDGACNTIKIKYIIEDSQSTRVVNIRNT